MDQFDQGVQVDHPAGQVDPTAVQVDHQVVQDDHQIAWVDLEGHQNDLVELLADQVDPISQVFPASDLLG